MIGLKSTNYIFSTSTSCQIHSKKFGKKFGEHESEEYCHYNLYQPYFIKQIALLQKIKDFSQTDHKLNVSEVDKIVSEKKN
jgi:hypothetical protein